MAGLDGGHWAADTSDASPQTHPDDQIGTAISSLLGAASLLVGSHSWLPRGHRAPGINAPNYILVLIFFVCFILVGSKEASWAAEALLFSFTFSICLTTLLFFLIYLESS